MSSGYEIFEVNPKNPDEIIDDDLSLDHDEDWARMRLKGIQKEHEEEGTGQRFALFKIERISD